MKVVRRSLMVIALVGLFVSAVLLLNFTAPNPTGRRYSSETPQQSGTSEAIGIAGERVLAKDLGLVRNDVQTERKCFCDVAYRTMRPPVSECRVCIAYGQLTTSHRRPDFIADNYVVESKNAQDLYYASRDIDQLGDIAVAARAAGYPLWLYIRIDTNLAPEFYDIVAITGGGIVPYYTIPGYIDPVDQAATIALIVSVLLLVLMVLWEFSARGGGGGKPAPAKPTPKGPLAEAADFADKSKDSAQERIDREDSRWEG